VIWSEGLTLAGRYRLESPLGASSMAVVWSGIHLPTRRHVALRRLPVQPDLLPGQASRVLADVRASAMVEHPNVAQCYEVLDEREGGPCLVTELLHGETLAQKLSRQPMLSVQEAASLLLPVVSALGTAHARGTVHGLLAASSVFMATGPGSMPSIRVLDFGIAKWLAAADAAPASTRAPAVALQRMNEYAAPELTLAARSIDHRADVWALGVLLYECLSGLRPLEFVPGEADFTAGTASFLPIEKRVPVPRALADLIAHMLVTDPEYRAQNLIELYHVLSPLSEEPSPGFGWPGSERRITALTQRAVPSLPESEPPAPTSAPPVSHSNGKRWRGLALAASVVAVVELVALVWLAQRVRRGEPMAAPIAAQQARAAAAPRAETLLLRAAPQESAMLDDFEDRDSRPLDAGFGEWQAFSVNPAGRALELKWGEGYRSPSSIEVSFLLEPVPGNKASPGAGVRIAASRGSLDLSQYKGLTFAHRFAPMLTPGLECESPSQFVVFLTCRAHGHDESSALQQRVPVSSTWALAGLELAEFHSADGRAQSDAGCLGAVDSLGFRADASRQIESGGCDSGMLWIDDVRLVR
jgi:serine/threonine protein kinase